MRRRSFLAAIVSLIFSRTVLGEINIAKSDRTANDASGSCVWACLDTLAKYHKLKVRFFNRYIGATCSGDVDTVLQTEGIPYERRYIGFGKKDMAFLKAKTDSDTPVMVSVTWWPFVAHQDCPSGSYHAIIVTGIKDGRVYMVDPNTPDKDWSWSEKTFESYWTGWAIAFQIHTDIKSNDQD